MNNENLKLIKFVITTKNMKYAAITLRKYIQGLSAENFKKWIEKTKRYMGDALCVHGLEESKEERWNFSLN
jgi:hypothetical protein